jgi:hypothetical protein
VPVATPRLIPNIGELALEAKDGVLLRRSQPALFAALARRPHGGCVTNGTRTDCESGQYIPIPANCVGNACATAILPEYSFSSSRTDIGNFVAPNTSALDPHSVLLNEHGETIPDPSSGLFCAYNPGTTTTTIKAGGLSASLTVTVQPGSVRRPCGTVPALQVQAQQAAAAAAPPPPTPAPAAAGPTPASTAPVVPVPPPPVAPAVPPRAAPPPPPPPAPLTFVPPIALAAPVIPFVPPPVPTPARPTPPSGTSAVTSPVEVAQEEEEEEEAPESVSNQAVAYRSAEHEPAPEYILGLIVLAALAGAAIRRPRRDGRTARVAPATLSAMRAQRRAADQSRVTRR